MSRCLHTLTRGREGETGSWCVDCGKKIYAVDKRECQHCAHFKLMPWPPHICTHHMMGVTPTMHVTYKIEKGTCFKETAA